MGWLYLTVALVGIILLFMSLEDGGVIFRDVQAKYIGGFSDVSGRASAEINIKEDEIIFNLVRGFSKGVEKIVPISNISKVEVKPESQIREEVSSGKMLVSGGLAFAKKENDSIINNCLVISCDDKGNSSDLIFETREYGKIVRKIKSIKG